MACERFLNQAPFHGFETHGPGFVALHARGRAQFRRHVFALDQTAAAQNKRLFDDVLQFADIARIVIFHEPGHDPVRHPRDILALQAVELGNEAVDQQRDVFPPLLQFRQLQIDHANPVIQVVAKHARTHQLREFLVRGGNDPNIDRNRFETAQRFDLTFLKHPQQPHLHGGGDVAELIQKNGPSVGQRKAPRFVAFCVRKRAGLVAEQLALEQGIRQRGAVDGHKRFPAPGREVVDGAREQLFPGPAGALDEHRARARGNLRHHVKQPQHRGTPPHNVLKRVTAFQLFLQLLDLGQILEGLHPPDHRAHVVAQQGRREANGDALPLVIHDVRGRVHHRMALGHRLAQRAVRLADAGAKDITAPAADSLLSRNAGDAFGRTVETRDPPFLIDRKNALVNGIQDGGFPLRCVIRRFHGASCKIEYPIIAQNATSRSSNLLHLHDHGPFLCPRSGANAGIGRFAGESTRLARNLILSRQ